MKPWLECLNEESRAEVMKMVLSGGVSIIQVRSKTNQSIAADALRPEIVRCLHKRGHSVGEICDAMNRGHAWVRGHLGPEKQSFKFRRGVKNVIVKTLASGCICVEEA